MSKRIAKKFPPVSVVIAHRNSSSTILHTLGGVLKQDYPIKEVLIIDNISTDDSLGKIKAFAKKNTSLHIKIYIQKENRGLSSSYNRGVKTAQSEHVIIMQADGVLPGEKEISRIMEPVLKNQDEKIAATTPYTLMPMYIWEKYNFWQKCSVATAVEKNVTGFNGKFDYVNKKLFTKIGGFDEINFNPELGGEDADITMRMKKSGKVVQTKARVVHLHYLGDDYSIKHFVLGRRIYARAYGRIIRMHGSRLPYDVWLLLIKPLFALSTFVPFLFPYNFVVMILFSIYTMKKMYTTRSTLFNFRILLLPFISLGLIYYETYWMIEAFLIPVKKRL